MIKQLYNIATKEELEDQFGLKLRYPKLYSPNRLIDGNGEVTCTVITNETPRVIDIAIWGILPEQWKMDWATFQRYDSTIFISSNTRSSDFWFSEAFSLRRCVFILTGFYFNTLEDGNFKNYLITENSGKSIAIAGIYNRLYDGFLTASPISGPLNFSIDGIKQRKSEFPVLISGEQVAKWLGNECSENDVDGLLTAKHSGNFVAELQNLN